MRFHITLSSYYAWEKLPPEAEPTEADIKKGIVKPSENGDWLMRVPRKCKDGEPTNTSGGIGEDDIVTLILQDAKREQTIRPRYEAAALVLARHTMPHHAHRRGFLDIDIHDDGPDVEYFTKRFDAAVEVGLAEEEDRDELLEAYSRPPPDDDTAAYIRKHFGVKPKGKDD